MSAPLKQKNTLASLAWLTTIILATSCFASEGMRESFLDNEGIQIRSSIAAQAITEGSKLESPEEYNTSYSDIQPNLMRKEGYPSSPLFIEISRPQGCQKSEEDFLEDFTTNQTLELKYSQELQQSIGVTVVIDVFRAFTTAPYVLEKKPETYMLATKSTVISRLASEFPAPLLIGKPEIGATLHYNIPNSPTRVKEVQVTGQNVLHRTEGGAKGVLDAKGADLILVAGLANAEATAQYIKKLINPKVTIVPMGHEATTPSLEYG